MIVEISDELEAAVRRQAETSGVAPEEYVRDAVKRSLPQLLEGAIGSTRSGRGMWTKYDFTLSKQDIDENRAEMLRNFGEDF
jgi:hypothetical protein